MAINAEPSRTPRPAPVARARAGGAAIALLVATLVCGVLAAVLTLRVWALVTAGALPVDGAVEAGVTAVGALVAGWLAGSSLVATSCLLVRMVGSSWRAGERFVHRCAPGVVRRALVVVVGVSVGLGVASGASATTAPPAPEPTLSAAVADDLGWQVTTPRPSPTPTADPPDPAPASDLATAAAPTARPLAPATASLPAAQPTPAPAATTVTVVAGDSLWAIAARHLPPSASDAEIAAAWPQWWRANAAVIGRDPDMIVPGQVLVAPTTDGASS